MVLSAKQVVILIRLMYCTIFYLLLLVSYCLFRQVSLSRDMAKLQETNAELRQDVAVYRALYDTQRKGGITAKQAQQALQSLQSTGALSQGTEGGKE